PVPLNPNPKNPASPLLPGEIQDLPPDPKCRPPHREERGLPEIHPPGRPTERPGIRNQDILRAATVAPRAMPTGWRLPRQGHPPLRGALQTNREPSFSDHSSSSGDAAAPAIAAR